jgi:hypothetical protein
VKCREAAEARAARESQISCPSVIAAKPLDNMEGTSNNDNFFVELIAGASRRDFCS